MAYGLATRLPLAAVYRLQQIAASNLRARRALRWLSAGVRHGTHRIAQGPGAGLMIDVSGGRPSYVFGTAEPLVQAFLVQNLRAGGVFYDLGANCGFFTLIAARLVGDCGYVRAYEPAPRNAAALRHNVALNGLGNVAVVEAAVSDRTGAASFDEGESDQVGRLGPGSKRVRVVSIDDEVARGCRPPDVIKIDVEGAELAAVTGMRRTLTEYRPVLVCEIHADSPSLDEEPVPLMLADLGYQLRWLGANADDETGWAPHLVAL